MDWKEVQKGDILKAKDNSYTFLIRYLGDSKLDDECFIGEDICDGKVSDDYIKSEFMEA